MLKPICAGTAYQTSANFWDTKFHWLVSRKPQQSDFERCLFYKMPMRYGLLQAIFQASASWLDHHDSSTVTQQLKYIQYFTTVVRTHGHSFMAGLFYLWYSKLGHKNIKSQSYRHSSKFWQGIFNKVLCVVTSSLRKILCKNCLWF